MTQLTERTDLVVAVDPDEPEYERSPRDVLRLAVFGLAAVALVALMAWSEETVLGVERDLIQLFAVLPTLVERLLAGGLQVIVVLSSLGLLGLALYRQPRRSAIRIIGYLLAAGFVSGLVMVLLDQLLDREAPVELLTEIEERAGIAHTGAGSTVSIAQLAASLVVIAPFVARRWRRAFLTLLGLVVLVRLTVAAHPPANVFVAVPVGVAVGSLLLYAFGRPSARPTAAMLRRSLADSGLHVVELSKASVDARGSTPYFATLEDGTELFVKIVDDENRAAGLLFWAYRSLRLKNVGDEQPYSTLRRGVEHEALMSLMARDVGIRTPRLRAVADVGSDAVGDEAVRSGRSIPDALILVTEKIAGASMDSVAPEAVSDELLRGIWQQLAVLRENRMVHRDLRLANIFVAADNKPWLIDFGFGEVAATDDLLRADVAQLLASLTVAVGPERAVDSAVAVLGPLPVAEALPRLQMPALAGATRTALKAEGDRLGELRTVASERVGVDEVVLTPVERLNAKSLVLIIALVGVVYFLLPQLADLPSIIEQVRSADWSQFPWILVMATVTFFGSALTMGGTVPQRIPLVPNVMAQLGSSFAGKVAPAGLGGMALRIRFLQRQGVDPAVAVAGVGLGSISGMVAHITLSVVFLVWAGPEGFGSIDVPIIKWIAYAAVALVAATIVGALLPSVRAKVAEILLPAIRRSVNGVSEVIRRPGKILQLLGGAVIVRLTAIIALYLSTLAFGGELSFTTIGACYLLGSAVASAVPVPGGIGAVEAALSAGLVALGMDNAIAVPAVFLYRLGTFWMPILPAWFAFRWLQRNEYI